jgi:serine protease AprX
MPILKIFATGADVPRILEHASLIERYPAFVVVEAERAEKAALVRMAPLEDISSQYEIRFGSRAVDTSKPRVTPRGRIVPHAAYRGVTPLDRGPHHYIVQFVGPVKEAWLRRLRQTGAKIRAPYSGFAYIVRATSFVVPKIAALPFVRWMGHLPPRSRIAPGIVEPSRVPTKLPRRRPRPGVYTVEAFDGKDAGRIAQEAKALGFDVLSTDPKAGVVIVKTMASGKACRAQIERLSAVHGVRFIRQRVVPRTTNNIATGIMGNSYAAVAPTGLKLTGAGETVAVCDTGLDTGDATTIHPDFAGRVVAMKSYPITPDWKSIIFNPGANDGPSDLDSGHGTHVAGSVLGDGSASSSGPALIRGHAHKAKLVFQAVEQEMKWRPNAPPEVKSERFVLAGIPTNLEPLFQFAYGHGARIHSNSWGGGDPGAYDDQCRQFDRFAWKHKDFCFVIAAGNDGTDADGNGKINPMSVSSPGTAKNCVTVGACENLRPEFDAETYGGWWPDDFPAAPFEVDPMSDDDEQVVAFSSRGPTVDGRVKPDVVAPGTFILSTRSSQIAANNFAWAAYPPNKKRYFHMGGTSMATPLTAGALALVREFLRTKQGIAAPSAALMKALLIAGAERLPGTAAAGTLLDTHQGFGRVDLDRSFRRVLATIDGDGLTTGDGSTASVAVSTQTKTLRVVMAYTDYPGETLINNLNLFVTAPNGTRYIGNHHAASTSNAMTLDGTNNVELVQVDNAPKGKWTIDVVASNVSAGPQDYAIAAVQV